jgi:thiosulfate dehydrogenase [quinone] large subunit
MERDKSLAYFLLRLILGLNIAVHGIGRLIAGPAVFAASLVPMFAKTPLPPWSVHTFGICLPWAEALVGVCVLFGSASRLAYITGMLEIAALTFGATMRQDWASAGIQLTYALLYALLLAMREYNTISLDHWLQRHSRKHGSLRQ